MTRDELAVRGRSLVGRFCKVNGLPVPDLSSTLPRGYPDACGLYDWVKGPRGTIHVQVDRCASCGYGGPAWSWPGYIIDRTPYGVHVHELGHHVDRHFWHAAHRLRKQSGEAPLTGYCPNSAEWFAEMFRLFATNPGLLALVRPVTYQALQDLGLVPVETRHWTAVLEGAPARTLAMAHRRVSEAAAATVL
jgi:hypothetical protein